MVIVTHEMSFARDVADRAIFMDQGRIVEQGEAKSLFANPQQARTRQFLEKFLMHNFALAAFAQADAAGREEFPLYQQKKPPRYWRSSTAIHLSRFCATSIGIIFNASGAFANRSLINAVATIFIHISRIYVLVLCIYNNDYHSGVIWSVMRDNDFFSWRREMLQQFQSVSAGEGVFIFSSSRQKGWNMTTSHSAYGIRCLLLAPG
jgi:hypothetical protein